MSTANTAGCPGKALNSPGPAVSGPALRTPHQEENQSKY